MTDKPVFLADASFCEFLPECEIFGFRDIPSSVEIALKSLYCLNQPHFDRCRRRQYWLAHGQPPPNTMLPSGRMLPAYAANTVAPAPAEPCCNCADKRIAKRSLEDA